MTDTANEVSTLDELLHSAYNRVVIARLLLEQGKTELLPTILEDLFWTAQTIVDNHCIKPS